MTSGLFQEKNLIAIVRDDTDPYGDYGYLAVKSGDTFGITQFSHCSCYDTWCYQSLEKGTQWMGTREEIQAIVDTETYYVLPGRKCDPADFGYPKLMELYLAISKWLKENPS